MQNQNRQRLKQALVSIAAVAVIAAGPFLVRKCSHEDIQKSMQSDGRKVGYVEKSRLDQKKAAQLITKLLGAMVIKEDNEDSEALGDDPSVRKIKSEFTWGRLMCEKLSKEETRKVFQDDHAPINNYRLLPLIFKIDHLLIESETMFDGVHYASDYEEADLVGKEIEKLGSQGSVEQLLDVLKHYDSFGVAWKDSEDNTGAAIFEYEKHNFKVSLQGKDYFYDFNCVSRHQQLAARVGHVIGQLSRIWIKERRDPKALLESIPESYQPEFLDNFLGKVFSEPEWSAEGDPVYAYSPEEIEAAVLKVADAGISPEYAADLVINAVENNEADMFGIPPREGEDPDKVAEAILRNFMQKTKNEKFKSAIQETLDEWKENEEDSEEAFKAADEAEGVDVEGYAASIGKHF